MKNEKEYINPKTGKPFPAKFIEQMKRNTVKCRLPKTEEAKRIISESAKKTIAKKRTFRDVARMILEMSPEPEIVEKLEKYLPGLSKEEITNRVAMMQKMVERALKGDSTAFQIVRDTAGEKPVDKQEVVGTVANTYTQIDKDEIKQALVDAKKVLNELE